MYGLQVCVHRINVLSIGFATIIYNCVRIEKCIGYLLCSNVSVLSNIKMRHNDFCY